MFSRIRYGMVGGASNTSFGIKHRLAAAAENDYELVCGAFSRDRKQSLELNKKLKINPERVYHNYQEMIINEAKLPKNRRMELISIVTPNNTHFEIAKLALEHGFHIVLEKPITTTLEEASALKTLLEETGLKCMVCYTYTGFPMLKQAKALIAKGDIGNIKLINVEFYQDILKNPVDAVKKQALWRMDSSQTGQGGSIADLGTHAFHLLEYVSGLKVNALNAQLETFTPDRRVNDYGSVLLKLSNGAQGVLSVSQAAAGENGNFNIRVYGEKASLQWELEKPDQLCFFCNDKPRVILRAGDDNARLEQAALNNGRNPAGKGEGSIDAFANHWHNFALDLRNKDPHQSQDLISTGRDYPSFNDGYRGMLFIDSVIASSKSEKKWLPLVENLHQPFFKNSLFGKVGKA